MLCENKGCFKQEESNFVLWLSAALLLQVFMVTASQTFHEHILEYQPILLLKVARLFLFSQTAYLFRPLSDRHHGLTTNDAIQLLVARPLYQNCHLWLIGCKDMALPLLPSRFGFSWDPVSLKLGKSTIRYVHRAGALSPWGLFKVFLLKFSLLFSLVNQLCLCVQERSSLLVNEHSPLQQQSGCAVKRSSVSTLFECLYILII